MDGIWQGLSNTSANHDERWSDYPKLRFKVSNGRTLCVPCHKKTDTYKGKLNDYL